MSCAVFQGCHVARKSPEGATCWSGFSPSSCQTLLRLGIRPLRCWKPSVRADTFLARATIVLPGKGKVWIKKSAIVKALGPLRHFFRYRGICIPAINHDMLDMYKMQKLSRHAARRRATGGPPLAVGIGASLAVVSSQLQLSQDGPECPRQGVHSLRNRAHA